jgi:hypothetical protein
MFDERVKELEKIKKEKAAIVEDIQKKIAMLQHQLRIAVDDHNRAAWILEEYGKIEAGEVKDGK